jgi:hypothetical protein
MKAVRTYETCLYFNETMRRYILEGCHIHIRRRESMESHTVYEKFFDGIVYNTTIIYF